MIGKKSEEQRKKGRKKRRTRKRKKSKFSPTIFSTFKRSNGSMGLYCT